MFRCWSTKWIRGVFLAVWLFFQSPLLHAAEKGDGEAPEWVLSYFLVLLCLGLAVLILLRPCNRSETTFTQEEIDQRRENEMKKMRGH